MVGSKIYRKSSRPKPAGDADEPGYPGSDVGDGGTWGSGSDNGSHEDRGPEGTRGR